VERLSQFELDLLKVREERLKYHAPTLLAVRPTGTATVRVTAADCPQDCAHCGGYYLKAMKPLSEVAEQEAAPWTSLLISGACDGAGVVPIQPHLATLKTLSKKYRLNLHPGYIRDPEAARQLAEIASVFSCDFIGDEAALRQVYGLNYSVGEVLDSLLLLAKFRRVVPHLCLGLSDEPGLRSELAAVKLLVEAGFRELVVLIFIPTRGTRLAERQPPPATEVAKFFASLGRNYPQLRVTLGCMRPAGKYRQEVDRYAVLAGINAIVQPTPGALQLADYLGMLQQDYWQCCVLYGDADAD